MIKLFKSTYWIANITNSIIIGVRLITVEILRTVVTGIAYAILIDVGLIRVLNVHAVVLKMMKCHLENFSEN